MSDTEQIVIPMSLDGSQIAVPAAEVQPQEDDIIATTEQLIRDECVRYTNAVLKLATGLVAAGPKAASRGLHLTEGLASLQSEMLRLLGMAKMKRRPRRVGAIGLSGYGGLGYGYDDEEPESFTGDALGETFGNKALNQLIAIFKPLVQQGGMFGMAQKAKGDSIESLTKALAEANKANLDQEIRGAILTKLKDALGEEPSPALAALPAPQPAFETETPLFVCGTKEDV